MCVVFGVYVLGCLGLLVGDCVKNDNVVLGGYCWVKGDVLVLGGVGNVGVVVRGYWLVGKEKVWIIRCGFFFCGDWY